LLLTYANDVHGYQQPAQFAHFLEEAGAGREAEVKDDLARRVYDWGRACEVVLARSSPAVGAFVRVELGNTEAVPLRRSFGAVGLDRLFECVRVDVSLHRRADTLLLNHVKTLAMVANPLAPWPIAQAKATREKDHDLVSQFWIEYNRTQGPGTLVKIAMPLWERSGAARLRGFDNKGKGYLELTWEDGETRHILTIPNQRTQPIHFVAEDYAIDPTARILAALEGQEAERLERFAARTVHTRLPRQVDPLKLGMTKKEVLRAVPNVRSIVKREIANGVVFTFTAEGEPQAEVLLREVSARWDDKGRVHELRARYVEGRGGHGKGLLKLLNGYTSRGGAPEIRPESANHWADLVGGKSSSQTLSWYDDTTLLTSHHDVAGVEVMLRDCPKDHPTGVRLPALEVLPRGPGACLLGATRADVLQAFDGKKSAEVDGAWVMTPDKTSPFNAVLVWFAKDRVHRIVARHRSLFDQPDKAGQGLREAWSRDMPRFGWPWRQHAERRQIVQNLGSHDDRSRVRIFWQEDPDGFHLFTEWKELQ
jgi:hypothetical protein